MGKLIVAEPSRQRSSTPGRGHGNPWVRSTTSHSPGFLAVSVSNKLTVFAATGGGVNVHPDLSANVVSGMGPSDHHADSARWLSIHGPRPQALLQGRVKPTARRDRYSGNGSSTSRPTMANHRDTWRPPTYKGMPRRTRCHCDRSVRLETHRDRRMSMTDSELVAACTSA